MRSRRVLAVGVVAVSLLGFAIATFYTSHVPPKPVVKPERAPPPRELPTSPVVVGSFGTPFSTHGCRDAVFSADGKRIATYGWSNDAVHIYDRATRAELFSVRVNPTNVSHSPGTGARFCESGQIVAFWCGYQDKPALVTLINSDGTHTSYPLSEGKLRQVREEYAFYEREASRFSISGNGTRLCVNWSGKIEVYETATGKAIPPKKEPPGRGEADRNTSVALSQNGRLLLLIAEAQIRVLSVETGDQVDAWEFPGLRVNDYPTAEFNSEGTKVLVTKSSGTLHLPGKAHIRDLRSKKTEDVPDGIGGPLGRAVFSPSGDKVAITPVWESEGPVVLWDTATKKVQRLGGTSRGISAVFSPGGDALAVMDLRGVLSLWSVDTGKLLPGSADPPTSIQRLRFFDDGQQLAAFAGRWVTWDVATGQRSDRLSGAARWPELSPNGKLAAKLDGEQLAVLSAETGKEQWSVQLPNADRFTRIRFSRDSTKLVTRTRETVRVWDVVSGRELSVVPVLPGQYLLAVSTGAKRVAIGFQHREMRGTSSNGQEWITLPAVYDTVTGEKLWESDQLVSEGYPAAFTPDDQYLAYQAYWMAKEGGGGPDRVVIRDAATGRLIWQPESRFAAYSLTFSPDGRVLALGQHKGHISLFQTTTGKLLGTLELKAAIRGLAFSPDGKTLAAASPEVPVALWDIRMLLPSPVP